MFSFACRTYFKYCELIVLYAIPLVFLTTLYSIMCRVLWGNEDNHNIANHSQQVSWEMVKVKWSLVFLQEAILKLRRSVVKMLIISMLLYFLCYTPIQGMPTEWKSRVWELNNKKKIKFTSIMIKWSNHKVKNFNIFLFENAITKFLPIFVFGNQPKKLCSLQFLNKSVSF